MLSSVRQRWIVYALALALTFSAVAWATGRQELAAVQLAPPAERVARLQREIQADSAVVVEAPTLNLDNLTRPPHAAPAGDPFPAKSWQQMDQEEAARRAPPPPPPPPPQAPPLPFTYMGKLIDGGGGVTAFLVWQGQDRNYIVRDGDTIDGAYRVETINEHALILTYLPLQQQQTLALGEGN